MKTYIVYVRGTGSTDGDKKGYIHAEDQIAAERKVEEKYPSDGNCPGGLPRIIVAETDIPPEAKILD